MNSESVSQNKHRALGPLRAYPTADGSFSLHSEWFGEAFHNSAGALNEAQAKFVQPAELMRFADTKTLRILDVCVGLGYNTSALLSALPEPAPDLDWWGLELDRRPLELALEQSSFQKLWSDSVLQRLISIRDHDGWEAHNSRGTQLWGDARQTIRTIPEGLQFDLILHDAHHPALCTIF